MKRMIILLLCFICFCPISVFAEIKYDTGMDIDSYDDFNRLGNYPYLKMANIHNLNVNKNTMAIFNNYPNIDGISIEGSIVDVSLLNSETMKKLSFFNSYITGPFNANYNLSRSGMVNGEYSYPLEYDDQYSRMAKYIYKEGMTPEEIIRAVTLFTVDYFEYGYSCEEVNCPEGTTDIIPHYGVCANYAEMETVLLNKLGIYAVLNGGYVEEDNKEMSTHAWTTVYLDGKWYEIDATWLDVGDREERLKKGKDTEYYMDEANSKFAEDHFEGFDIDLIPVEERISKISVLNKLDEIGEYEYIARKSQVNVDDVEVSGNTNKVIVIPILFIGGMIIGIIIYFIKKKKKIIL